MNEPIAAALRARLNDNLRDPKNPGTGIATTVVPPDWHLTDPDLDRDAVFYEKPYTL